MFGKRARVTGWITLILFILALIGIGFQWYHTATAECNRFDASCPEGLYCNRHETCVPFPQEVKEAATEKVVVEHHLWGGILIALAGIVVSYFIVGGKKGILRIRSRRGQTTLQVIGDILWIAGWLYLFFGKGLGGSLAGKVIGFFLVAFSIVYTLAQAFDQPSPFWNVVYVGFFLLGLLIGGFGYFDQNFLQGCNESDKLCEEGFFCGIDYQCHEAPQLQIRYQQSIVTHKVHYTSAGLTLALSFVASAIIVRKKEWLR